ncbi:MAG TPA: ankyrin repeat domain-containing protein [Allosphingosinicella sp.]|jgi:tetratricopeptide (TPR) repeat protein
MPTKAFPSRPSLDWFKKQAGRLLRDRAAGDPQACQRLREFHPSLEGADDLAIAEAELRWSDALFAVAREYGFASWPRLKAKVEGPAEPGTPVPHHRRIEDPDFRRAVDLIDDGDVAGLAAHLAAHPGLATRRVMFEGENYFRNPALLSFIAENPVRHDCLPPNIVEIARLILESGARADKAGLDETLMLVASGRVARECGVQEELIALLCAHGADADRAVTAALGHGEFGATEALMRHGARLTLPVAAALGRSTEARALFQASSAAERHYALAFAAQHGHAEIIRMLLDAGEDSSRYNPPSAHSHSTPLHQAVWNGHEEVVRLLVRNGARLDLRDTIHDGTPLDWAKHCGRSAIAAYLEASPGARDGERMSEAERLFAEGGRLRLKGDSVGARPLLVQAVALARESDDRWRLGRLLARLGQIERDLGEIPSALACYSEAAELARQADDPLGLAHRLRHIGDIHQDSCRLETADGCYEEALAVYRNRADAAPLDFANALRSIAMLREKQGRGDEALGLWNEARSLYERAGVPMGAEESANRADRL